MRPRNLTVVLAAVVGAALAVACGSASEHPPVAQLSTDSPDATTASDGGRGDDATARDAAALCLEADGAPPAGCTCRYAYGPNFLVIDIPCGYTFCSDGKMEAAECSARGELTIVPLVDIAHCPLADSDASALPPCGAGTTTPDASSASDAAR